MLYFVCITINGILKMSAGEYQGSLPWPCKSIFLMNSRTTGQSINRTVFGVWQKP